MLDNAVVFDDVAITVEKTGREACDRCRQVRRDVRIDEKLLHLCGRCTRIAEAFHLEATAGGSEEN